jgi:hypothetical protein
VLADTAAPGLVPGEGFAGGIVDGLVVRRAEAPVTA